MENSRQAKLAVSGVISPSLWQVRPTCSFLPATIIGDQWESYETTAEQDHFILVVGSKTVRQLGLVSPRFRTLAVGDENDAIVTSAPPRYTIA